MTDTEVRKIVAVLMGAFPGARITQETTAVYERMIRDLEYPLANAAVERLLATCKFMPTVAEIRETALALAVGEQKPGGEAWGKVLALVARYGSYREPGKDFEIADPVLRKSIASLGWREICLSENQAADRARFIELYDKLAVQERRKQASDSLPAMQRWRELQSKQEARLEERTGSQPVGKLLAMLIPDGEP